MCYTSFNNTPIATNDISPKIMDVEFNVNGLLRQQL